jgi:hypothetical protein
VSGQEVGCSPFSLEYYTTILFERPYNTQKTYFIRAINEILLVLKALIYPKDKPLARASGSSKQESTRLFPLLGTVFVVAGTFLVLDLIVLGTGAYPPLPFQLGHFN